MSQGESSATQVSQGDSSAAPSARGTVLVFEPGAGGSTAKAMVELHAQLEAAGVHVYWCDPARRNVRNPGHHSNTSRVIATAASAAAAHPGARIVLGGASFGNRVVAELLRTRRDELPPANANALVSCGYRARPV